MTDSLHVHPVYRSINRLLTIWGVERRLFFLALVSGAATFNFFGSLLSGMAMFGALYLFARWATRTDPQILRFLLTAAKLSSQYDPAKLGPVSIRRTDHA